MSYAGRTKYDDPGRVKRYEARDAGRHREEWALIERSLSGIAPPATVLDVPCGTGRIAAEFLARGAFVRCADLSPAMREAAASALMGRRGLLGVEAIDLEESPPPVGWAAHLVVCFRLLHHLPDVATRGRVLATLAALAKPYLLVSFHHPLSGHNLARAVRRLASGVVGDRHSITVSRLAREAAEHGLVLRQTAALAAYRRELWVALFERVGP